MSLALGGDVSGAYLCEEGNVLELEHGAHEVGCK